MPGTIPPLEKPSCCPLDATMFATVTDQGRITLPKALRVALALEPGSKLEFVIQDDNAVCLRVLPKGSAGLYGLLAVAGEAARTLEEIDAAKSGSSAGSVKRRAKQAAERLKTRQAKLLLEGDVVADLKAEGRR